MFGKLGDLANIMKQAKEMGGKIQQMQESLQTLRYEADSGAGAVSAIVNGKLELVGLKISPTATSDVEMLEDLVRSAVSAAQRKASEGVQSEMAKMTGGLNIPGIEGLIGPK